jgi:hypothetical protein
LSVEKYSNVAFELNESFTAMSMDCFIVQSFFKKTGYKDPDTCLKFIKRLNASVNILNNLVNHLVKNFSLF